MKGPDGRFLPGDRLWTPEQVDYLKAHFANTRSREIADALGKRTNQVNVKAKQLGIKKSPEHIKHLLWIEATRLRLDGAASRFKKGNVPANAGKKVGSHPNSAATQFKKGQAPHNWVPVGSVLKTTDGYWRRKVAEPSSWVFLHIENWTAAHGPIPPGHCVFFRDGNRDHYGIDNLELLSLAQKLEKFTIHRYPDDLKALIRMSGKLNRKLQELQHEKRN
jgi:HNH endonuclease